MLRFLIQLMCRHHHQVHKVDFGTIGPTINDYRRAQARKRLADLHIPEWEPYAPFARPGANVAATWRDRG